MGNEFFRSGVYNSGDPDLNIKNGPGDTPAWKEFRANRAGNMVETEFNIMFMPPNVFDHVLGIDPGVDTSSKNPIHFLDREQFLFRRVMVGGNLVTMAMSITR